MIKSKKLKLARETLATLADPALRNIQGGGGTFQTKGRGCEPSGIIACPNQ